jgi:hypothetical protein
MQPAGAADPPRDPVFEQVARAVAKGECILFVGAGVHAPPPDGQTAIVYPAGERPPLGGALSQTIAGACGFAGRFPDVDARNLQRTAQYYEMTLGRQELCELVRREVDEGKRPSPALRALGRLGFSHIITTNYDSLLEDALRDAGRRPTVTVYSPEAHRVTPDPSTDPDPDHPLVFKIHGSTSDPPSMVITEEDYIRFVMRMGDLDQFHPVPETIRFRLKKWPTLFIGYSLIDYNLRLLFMTLRWKLDKARFPRSYSVDRRPDPIIASVYQDQREYVHFIVRDLWSFVPDLYRAVRNEDMPA